MAGRALALALITALGCGGNQAAPAAPAAVPPPDAAPDRIEQFLASEQVFRDRVCACADIACAAAASKDWQHEVLRNPPPKDLQPTEAQNQRAMALLGEADACQAKFAPTGADFGEVITAIGVFADRMCACADEACRGKVQGELQAWEQANTARFNSVVPTAAQEHVVTEAMGRIMTCASGAH
ncbi:MAG: hypothetical protein K8W52_01650 [Deltaproteobacteria bacterium]|nr:hypothetical protein [Deltaproteobacteria bacterium]